MIGKRHKVKEAGDERLLKVVAQLQRQLAEQKVLIRQQLIIHLIIAF